MRILQLHNFYATFGGECSVVHAERRLLESAGHVVFPYTAESGKIAEYPFWRKTLTFLQIPYNFIAAHTLAQFLQKERPDIAHIHNIFPLFSPSIYPVFKKFGIPVVQTIHNYRFLCPNGLLFTQGKVCNDCRTQGYVSAIKKKCMHGNYSTSALYAAAIWSAWRSGNISRNIDRFVLLNQFGAQLFTDAGIPPNKIRICGNYVEKIAESSAAKEPYLLYLGRLSAEKGLRTLLAAMHKVPDGVALKIAGSGPLEMEFKDIVHRRPSLRIDFLGFISGAAKEELIARALCTVIPSEWYENFPISVLESLAQGTPVIASRIGGLPELIDHGVNGLLFDSGDADALAEQIARIFDQSREAQYMASAALETARTRFSSEVHLHTLNTIYNECLHARL